MSNTQPLMHKPKLSVYTISFADAKHCLTVIRDLRSQTITAEIELIVVADSFDGISEDEFHGFATHQMIRMPGLRALGIAMATAVHAARAPYVTYAEEHATFDAEWAAALVDAHQRGYAAVGFAMRNSNPQTITSWAHLYGQFGPSVDPVETTEVPLLTGHHASYSRDVLVGYGDHLAAMLEDEGALFLHLTSSGYKLLMEGRAISYHINLSQLSAYAGLDFHGQRSFAAARAMSHNWPVWKRLAFACACPLVPFVRLKRILHHLRRTKRFGQLMPQILFPLACGLGAGGVGEAIGYLAGAGKAAERKFAPEVERRRFLSASDPLREARPSSDS